MTWATVSVLMQTGCNKVINLIKWVINLIIINVWFVVKCKVSSHVDLTFASYLREEEDLALVLIRPAD